MSDVKNPETKGSEDKQAEQPEPEKPAAEGAGADNAEFKPPTSQKELDALIEQKLAERLAKEKEELMREKTDTARQLEQQMLTYKQEAKELKTRFEHAKEKLAEVENAYQLNLMRKDVADETGVPEKLLRGQSLKELVEHAGQIKESFEQTLNARKTGYLPKEKTGLQDTPALNSPALLDMLKRVTGAI